MADINLAYIIPKTEKIYFHISFELLKSTFWKKWR